MTDRPILFSTSMVRALLEGRKTQTRRVLCLHDDDREPPYVAFYPEGARAVWCDPYDSAVYGFPGAKGSAVGDRLWVRETWGDLTADHPLAEDGRKPAPGDRLVYRANPGDAAQWIPGHPGCSDFTWRPSIHMPRWASRLTLIVTDVRVQRVQEISREDARAEGMPVDHNWEPYDPPPPEIDSWQGYARASFSLCWSELNEKRGFGWYANPWVVALTFTVRHQNIDETPTDPET